MKLLSTYKTRAGGSATIISTNAVPFNSGNYPVLAIHHASGGEYSCTHTKELKCYHYRDSGEDLVEEIAPLPIFTQQGRTDMLNDVCDLLMRECPLLTNGVEVSGWLIRALKEKGGGKV